ncbi:unnamed protein product [Heligmosomoides polygyrus]|uniref:6-phospho-beta-glucosidase n=1 Tax=Heligmosomoides polygyrus TaxID=6339 RepID=A0A183GS41_HELPZ|nr:unnamed protein product [Heligmosomoides polygyrus]
MWLRYVPEGLLLLLQYIQRTYAVPVMVTENGCADVVGAQAQNLDPLNDEHRIRYIRGHIEAVRHGKKLETS